MKIYHYTNLEALALILKNKTIRFNRLDQVDDMEEGNAESLGVRFCKYVFVSCWTESSEESIPLWKMYGGDLGGVRIAVDHEMFREYLVLPSDLKNDNIVGGMIAKIPPHDMINPNFYIVSCWHYNNDLFFRRIQYVDNVFEHTQNAIQITNIQGDRGDCCVQMKPFGYYKHKRWAFQNETRFVLYILPFNPMLEVNNPELSTIVIQSLLCNKSLPFTYYDMALKDEILDSMEITLSPSVTEAQRIIAQAIVDKYAPQAQIRDSSLGELVRLK